MDRRHFPSDTDSFPSSEPGQSLNPHSRANRLDPTLAERFADALGDVGQVVAALSLDQLDEEVQRLVDAPPDVIGIHGGDGTLHPFAGQTGLYLRPGHAFRGLDALLTNFHLPRSSLLVLVAALAGPDLIRDAYAEAVRHRYRFYSYGDAMLIV